MKTHIAPVTEQEAAALLKVGKYTTGTPLFWCEGNKVWADKTKVRGFAPPKASKHE